LKFIAALALSCENLTLSCLRAARTTIYEKHFPRFSQPEFATDSKLSKSAGKNFDDCGQNN
jgi:hypothetical protein